MWSLTHGCAEYQQAARAPVMGRVVKGHVCKLSNDRLDARRVTEWSGRSVKRRDESMARSFVDAKLWQGHRRASRSNCCAFFIAPSCQRCADAHPGWPNSRHFLEHGVADRYSCIRKNVESISSLTPDDLHRAFCRRGPYSGRHAIRRAP